MRRFLEEVVLKEILEEVVLKEILEEVLEVEHFSKKYGVNQTKSEFRIAISVEAIQILI